MERSFEIYHVMPNKTRTLIADVKTSEEVKYIVESTKYPGTWLTEKRKLLRFGRGEIQIQERIEPTKIQRHRVIQSGVYASYELDIINDPQLLCIRIEANKLIGYGIGHVQLWNTTSFTELCNIVDKELAYQCFKYHERLVDQFKLDTVI